jgi:predicted O-methyltransferase YrrM
MNDVMTDEEFVESLYTRFLLRNADEGGKQHYLGVLAAGQSRLDVIKSLVTSSEFFDLLCQQRFGPQTGSPFLTAAPPGHFYSPLPSAQSIEELARVPECFDTTVCPGVDLRVERQLALLAELAPLASGLDISDRPTPTRRFYADNGSFSPGDAVLLAALVQWARPRQIVEVGAGFSTALMLDVIEQRLPGQVALEAIDPEPARVKALLRPGDETRLVLREGLVQNLPATYFTRLRANDILFIDSSHVMKLGSDVTFLLNEIVPHLSPGVLVHVHDIAWPFEYPVDHYRHGWAWNEAHALRLLLTYSSRYEVLLFADYLVRAERAEVRRILPEFLRQRPGVSPDGNSACSFWFRVRPEITA